MFDHNLMFENIGLQEIDQKPF